MFHKNIIYIGFLLFFTYFSLKIKNPSKALIKEQKEGSAFRLRVRDDGAVFISELPINRNLLGPI